MQTKTATTDWNTDIDAVVQRAIEFDQKPEPEYRIEVISSRPLVLAFPLLNGTADKSAYTEAVSANNVSSPGTRSFNPLISPSFGSPSLGSENADAIKVEQLSELIPQYLLDLELDCKSPNTITTKRQLLKNFLWFLNHRGYAVCGTTELRQFLYYLLHGHEEPGGRFGRAHLTRPARPITVKDYYVCLCLLFKWLVKQGELSASPCDGMKRPTAREEVKPPLAREQIHALLEAASRSESSLRDRALLFFFLDSGCRLIELTTLSCQDMDFIGHRCHVLGKGNKKRTIPIGEKTIQILKEYLRSTGRLDENDRATTDSPVFLGRDGKSPLKRSGVQQLMKRLRARAGIRESCSPHSLRRTFAVEFLRNGANVFGTQAVLGHSDLQQTRRYCATAQTDVEGQHKQFGPVDGFGSLIDEFLPPKA